MDAMHIRLDTINNFNHQLNNFHCISDMSTQKIRQFLDRNLRIIANQKDVSLYNQLMQLSHRIDQKWNNTEAHKLSFEIMGIAKGVLEFQGTLPRLPDVVWEQILSYLPPQGDHIRHRKGGTASGLKDFYPSKTAKDLAKRVEHQWAGEQLVSLKKYGCKTAKEALQYAINNKLTGANFAEFPDLDESDLHVLFEMCPQLNQLSICSQKIQKLPDAANTLQKLDCRFCQNLQSLPPLPLVQDLNCSVCRNLQSLPELPNVEILCCNRCLYLQSLPKLPRVQKLFCSFCPRLQNIPDLPEVRTLNCRSCPNLKSLPKLPQVQELICSFCPSLQHLPELSPGVLVLR
jgi:hypothetical protein